MEGIPLTMISSFKQSTTCVFGLESKIFSVNWPFVKRMGAFFNFGVFGLKNKPFWKKTKNKNLDIQWLLDLENVFDGLIFLFLH